MLDVEQKIVDHYTHGSLESAIQSGLEKLKDVNDNAAIDLLAAVDEFHIGGRQATRAVGNQLQVSPGQEVLDVGCGLGGTARYLASTYDCNLTGIDITPEYINVGNALNRQLGMHDQISLKVASALDMPFEDAHFDRATMLHVGMNIADKNALFAEIGRVIKPAGQIVVYDVMRTSEEPLAYPVAWALDETTSFVTSPQDYREALEKNGFEVMDITPKPEVAIKFFEAIKARLAAGGPPPLGLHIVMGKDAPVKVGNMFANAKKGAIAPVQILARKV